MNREDGLQWKDLKVSVLWFTNREFVAGPEFGQRRVPRLIYPGVRGHPRGRDVHEAIGRRHAGDLPSFHQGPRPSSRLHEGARRARGGRPRGWAAVGAANPRCAGRGGPGRGGGPPGRGQEGRGGGGAASDGEGREHRARTPDP